jgi:hypothetical protein
MIGPDELFGPALPRLLREFGGLLLEDETTESILRRSVDGGRLLTTGIAEASTTLIHAGLATTSAYTGVLALTLDELQYEADQGPSLDAARAGEYRSVQDMNTETRWPDFTAGAIAAGVLCSLSVPMPMPLVGALNLYATEPGTFADVHIVEEAMVLARCTSVALANVRAYAASRSHMLQIEQAMQSRAVIEQAKGILMGLRRCDADEAFQLLRTLSQKSKRKVRDVAEALVDDASAGAHH